MTMLCLHVFEISRGTDKPKEMCIEDSIVRDLDIRPDEYTKKLKGLYEDATGAEVKVRYLGIVKEEVAQ